jgi:hypothetical protein
VSLRGELTEGRRIALELIDPWALVRRVRWLEGGPGGTVERPAPQVHQGSALVEPSVGALRASFDALDRSGVSLAHLEVATKAELVASPLSPTMSRWPGYTLVGAAVLGLGAAIAFFALGLSTPPDLGTAAEVNAHNAATSRYVTLGWVFSGLAAGLGLGGGLVLAR